MSRVQQTLLNAKVNVFFHLLFLFLQFFARKIFLENLGDEFIGLTSTLQSFLGFLNLAELGIGTAIGFALYRPIFDKNYSEINNLIRYFGFLYKRIGLIVLSAGIIISLTFPWMFENLQIPLFVVYYAFFGFLFNSLLSYFFNYHLFLLQADQKDYVVAKYFQSVTLIKISLQVLILFFTDSYLIWITLEIISSVVASFLLRKRIKKEYPWLIISSKNHPDDDLKKYPSLFKKIKQISVHKLGTFVTTGTDNIVIFSFISVQSVAYFGNYMLIINNFSMLINKLFSGTVASVGNLVAEGNRPNIKKVFWEIMALRFYIAGTSTAGIYFLVDPFIRLWLGEKYILSELTIILFCLNFYIVQIRQPIEIFKQAYGLYSDTWAPLVQIIVNLGLSILLAPIYGIPGILFGTFVSSTIIVIIWRPIYVFRSGFQENVRKYFWGFLKLNLLLLPSFFILKLGIDHFENFQVKSYTQWFLMAGIIGLTSIIVNAISMYLMNNSFRILVARLKVFKF